MNANGNGLFDAQIFELSLWQGAVLASRMLCSVSFLNRLPFERAFLGLAQAAFADKGVDKTCVLALASADSSCLLVLGPSYLDVWLLFTLLRVSGG